MSGRFWICALCGAETTPGPECVACGGEPRLLGRFILRERLVGDGRGAVYAGEDEAGAPVRVRITTLPAGDAAAGFEVAARAWLRQAGAGIATPLAFGGVGGRFARVEAVVEGRPLRGGLGLAAALAVLERVFDVLATLHEAGVAHGGVRLEAFIRRADGLVLLTDFAPEPVDSAEDLSAAARLARGLTAEALPPAVADLLTRLEGAPRSRPSAAEARDAIHHARATRPNPAGLALTRLAPPPTSGTRQRRLVGALVLAAAAGGAFWWHQHTTAGVWQGTLTGRVHRTEGQAPVRRGALCEVTVARAGAGEENCRIEVRCGEVLLFGGGEYGLARCAGQPPRAEDPDLSAEDGDPALDLAADQRSLRIWDARHAEWAVEIELDSP